jgi:RNase P/RNase MRP subunit POP5
MVKSDALRKRYILFELKGQIMDEDTLKKAIQTEALKFLEKVLGFLALVNSLNGKEARLVSKKSSGTILSLDQPRLDKQGARH